MDGSCWPEDPSGGGEEKSFDPMKLSSLNRVQCAGCVVAHKRHAPHDAKERRTGSPRFATVTSAPISSTYPAP